MRLMRLFGVLGFGLESMTAFMIKPASDNPIALHFIIFFGSVNATKCMVLDSLERVGI